MALDSSRRVLCFDGEIRPGQDYSLIKDLEAGGLFVVRGFGNDASAAITISNLLRERRASVVIHDYCLFACASYLFVASATTIVLKDSLVAWRHFGVGANDCAGFARESDDGVPRFEAGICAGPPLEVQSEPTELERSNEQFYNERLVDPFFRFPPQSLIVRRTLKNLVGGTGAYPNVVWMWNPRHYASSLKTRIDFEAYPKSQAETDAIAARLKLLYRVIHDP